MGSSCSDALSLATGKEPVLYLKHGEVLKINLFVNIQVYFELSDRMFLLEGVGLETRWFELFLLKNKNKIIGIDGKSPGGAYKRVEALQFLVFSKQFLSYH